MVLRIVSAEICGAHILRLAFNDGTQGIADLSDALSGPIFEPLSDPKFFARGTLDPVCGTVVWPNGADFAPEALRDKTLTSTST